MILTADIKFQEQLKDWARFLIAMVLLISILTLVGWQFDVKYFIHFIPGLPPMNPTAALIFLLFSISFFLLTGKNKNKKKQFTGNVIAFIVLVISTIKLFGNIFRLGFKIDFFIFHDRVLAEAVSPVYAQMSPVTAFCFINAALALLLLDFETKRHRIPAQYMALVIGFFGLPSFLGYIFTIKAFHGDFTYVLMAVHASISCIFIAIAILFATPDRGIMKELTKPFVGSMVARRLIPIAVLIPVILGLLNLYMRLKGIATYELGNTILIMCLICSLLWFIFYNTKLLNKRDFENKESEEELTETNYFLNTVLENIPDMIFVKDAHELRFFRFNKAGEELLGYSKNDLIGKNDYDFFPKEQADFFTQNDRDVITSGSMLDIEEEPIVTKNGERWLHTKKIPVRDVNGTPLYLLGISEDITEKRKVKERLKQLNAELEIKVEERTAEIRRGEARFRILIENSQEGVLMINKDLIPIYRSPSTERITGWTTEERIKLNNSIELIHPDDVTGFKEAIQKVIANPEKIVPVSFRTMHKAGYYIWLEGFLTNMLHDDVLNAIIFNFRDVTERRMNEMKIEQSEKKYRDLFENNPMPVWVIDSVTSRFMDVNESAIKHYGYSREEFLSMTALDIRPDEDKERYIEISGSKYKSSGNKGIWRHFKKDGTIIYVEIIVVEMLFEGKEAQLILANDVTVRKQAEDEIEKLTKELRQLLEHLQISREEERKYIAREIHDELGQRLTALKIDVSMMRRKIPVGVNQSYFKDEMNSIIRQIDQSIESIKRIATDLRPEILDHHGILEAVKWQAQKFENTTGIKCNLSHLSPDINLQPELTSAVYRIVQEALTNIARHAQATSANIFIEQDGQKLLVEIKDNGKGINEEQVKSMKSLGLIGIRERVNLLKGTLSIKGKSGKGTIVSAVIPI